MMSRTRSVESLGSSMWSRTKSLRLPTDFIETVWWNSSSACSERIPRRRRSEVAYLGNSSKISAPAARSLLRRSRRSEPKSAKSVAIDSVFCGGDEEAVGLSSALALLEDLGQGDRLVVAVVGEDSEDHRVGSPRSRAGPWRGTCRWPRFARTCSGPRRRSAGCVPWPRHRRPCCRRPCGTARAMW